MTVAARPATHNATRQSLRGRAIAAAVLIALGCGGAYMAWGPTPSATVATSPAQLYTVVPMDLEIKLSKNGEIHAVNNIDVLCQVEGSSTITSIVKEGATVKKGDVLLTLDSTDIRQKMEDTALQLQKAQADLANAREMMEIQKSTNAANLEGAEVTLSLAKLDLKQYLEGTYPQQLANARTDVEMARITLNNRLEDLEQARKLYAKNFVTAADIKKAELDVTTARNSLQKAETALKVLTEYSHEIDLTSRRNSVIQAEQRLNRVKRENTSQITWRTADLTSKEQNVNVLTRRHDRLKQQYEACAIHAPAAGLVIYGSTTERNNNNPIQEGAQVRERQRLIRLPDTSQMKAVVSIHEAMVSKLALGQRASVRIVGIPEPLGATLSRIAVVADSSNRWWNPDLREYPVDLTLDSVPEGLKPGLGAVVEIFIGRLDQVLAVPVDAVYTVGEARYVFVPRDGGITPQMVSVGGNNDTHVQITSGLQAGETILRLLPGQGREFLEKAGRQREPATRAGQTAD